MPLSGVPQLITGPYDPASLILSDSTFETAQITLSGVSGIALNITDTSNTSISSMGGILLAGDSNITSTSDVSLDMGITAALVVDGGVYIDKKLYVNDTICLSGDIEIGITGGETDSSIFLGAENDINSWKFIREGGILNIYKWDTILNNYELMLTLEPSLC